jgi:hypothetical protein
VLSGNTYVKIGSGDSNDCNNPLTTAAQGTAPLSYQFQWQDGMVWTPITTSGTGVALDLSSIGWDNGITYDWAGASDNVFRIKSVNPGSDDSEDVNIRCVVSNSYGSTTSNVLNFRARDDTGNWIVSKALPRRTPLQRRTLAKLRIWGLRHRKATTSFYLGDCGKELVERMVAQGCDFGAEKQVVLAVLAQPTYVARYTAFEQMVAKNLAAYWPDCPDPVGQQLIASVKR